MAPEDDSAAALIDRPCAEVGNSGAPEVRLGAYEGPLDLLLELARAQRVDLARLSISALAEQFAMVVNDAIARRDVPLPRLADWLVMVTWLTLLCSRLLLPADDREAVAAEREAADLRRRLADCLAAQRLADWLERRQQLGREIFARGAPEPAASPALQTDLTDLLRACLKLLELPARERVYQPSPPRLWRVPEALGHIRRLLGDMPQGMALEQLLPSAAGRDEGALWRRSALASTLVASLELERDGALNLEQDHAFGAIQVSAPSCTVRKRGLGAPLAECEPQATGYSAAGSAAD